MLKNRKRVSYSISKDILKKFNELGKKLGSNKSKVVEILIERWIKENDNK